MSYMTQFDISGVLTPITEITGNAGVPVLPVGGNVNIVGADLITTTGAGDTLTITLDNGTNGQVILGGGAGPLWASLASSGSTIVYTPGANSLNLEVGATVATSYNTDAGTAVPALNVLTVIGGTGISTSGAGSTITITNTAPPPAFTLTGNSGGALSPTLSNWNILTANSTVTFAGLISTLTLDFAKDNLLLGSSGSAITTGTYNVCVGNESGQDLTTGEENTLIGWESGRDITTSQNNTGVGSACLWRATTNSEANVAIGQGSLQAITANANNNTGCGTFTFFNLAGAANYNVGVGYNTGAVYTTTESSNILLNHWGVLADSNTLRIGFGTGAGNQQLNKAYICGIDGVNVGSVAKVVTMASDQLGTATVTAGTGITVTPGANLITITNSSPGSALTITGNSGGALTPTAGNWNLQTAGATAKVVGAVSTFTLDFAIDNLILGSSPAGITTATNNVALGINAALSITTATNSVYVGEEAGRVVTTSSNNTGIGYNALTGATTTSAENTAVGSLSLASITSGAAKNTAVGAYSLISIGANASYNAAFGWNAAANLGGSSSSNVHINSWGTAGQSNTLVIGMGTGAGNQQLNAAYICGIDGVNVGSVAKVVTMASDQLGTATITAGTAISVTAGANTITVAATGLGAFAWAVITANQTAVVNNGYICNKAGTLALALPATGAIGDIIEVTGINTATGWQITQAANQQIFYGISSTTVGVTGTITSTAIRDSIRMVCVVSGASTVWNVISGVGSPIIV